MPRLWPGVNRLFFKIFFGFWLNAVLMILVVHLSYRLLDMPQDANGQHYWRLRWEIQQLFSYSERKLDENDFSSLLAWLKAEPISKELTVYVFDKNNQQLFGQANQNAITLATELTADTPELRERMTENSFEGKLLYDNGVLAGKMLIARPGTNSELVMDLEQSVWWRFIFAIFVSGLGCYWLAKRAAKPIMHVSKAARDFAAGDLNARTNLKSIMFDDEVVELGKDFNQMADNLQQTFDDQKQLIRDISHELRSPLGRMKAAIALAQRKRGVQSEEFLQLERECDRLNDLINQLLTMPDQKPALDDVIDLIGLLTALVDDNRVSAQTNDTRLTFTSDQEQLLIHSTGDLLYKAIDNLIRNAIRHTPQGSEIKVRCEQQGQQIIITVKDEGEGVPENELDRIFLPFYRVQSARERDSGGYGLGLSIAQRAVQQHGGCLSAKNIENGFLIAIRLPVSLAIS
jgi:two-component system sensor histidine kinase CpxA